MTYAHAIVWLDHRSARVIRFSRDDSVLSEMHSTTEERRLHRKSGVPGSGHAPDDHQFFDVVVEELAQVPAVLIVGPGTAKKAFELWLQHRHPDVSRRIVGVETLDHPTDGELLAHARKFFKRLDQLGFV